MPSLNALSIKIEIEGEVVEAARQVGEENRVLRGLLRELVAYDRLGEQRDYDRCHYCGSEWALDIEHAGDCPVARARAKLMEDVDNDA